jgi:signal peptidase II
VKDVKKLQMSDSNINRKSNKNFFSALILKKSYFYCFFITILTFSLDRISKSKIIEHQLENSKIYINDFLNLDLVWNTGIGFGLLSFNSSIIYNLITTLIGLVIIFLIYLLVKSVFVEKIIFSVILGGALGNFYDRLTYYAVPDFIDLHYRNFHWFTFNMADIFITVGIIMLLAKELFINEKK